MYGGCFCKFGAYLLTSTFAAFVSLRSLVVGSRAKGGGIEAAGLLLRHLEMGRSDKTRLGWVLMYSLFMVWDGM